ncbi:MAG: type II toxin-antitoxin system ParD family antitoxin [Meiothermus sp.]
MNVSLTPELERWIEAKVKSGLYQTNSKVVREALRAMREREEKIAAIREKLDEAEADIQAGRVVPAEQLFDFIKSEVERHKQKV